MELLAADSYLVTDLSSLPAPSDTVESEGGVHEVHKNLSEAAVYLDTEKSGPAHFSSPFSSLWFRPPPHSFFSPLSLFSLRQRLCFSVFLKKLYYLQIHKYAKQGPTPQIFEFF